MIIGLTELVDYIDWKLFYLTWSLAGKYPRILQDEVVGKEAQILFTNAKNMLTVLCNNPKLKAIQGNRIKIFVAVSVSNHYPNLPFAA